MSITIELDRADFDALTTTSMAWHGTDWERQADRFRPYTGTDPISWAWRYAYWLDSAAAMILARSYLASIGEDHQALWDEAEGEPLVIVTDYAASVWTANSAADGAR